MNVTFIENKILRLCARPRSFEYISSNIDGLEPTELIKILEKLKQQKKIQKKEDFWNTSEKVQKKIINVTPSNASLYLKKHMGYFDFLKIPHPLDFEWRNSTSSLNHLINLYSKLNNSTDKILLLGMPTLFATASLRDSANDITLVERNEPIIKGLKKLKYNKKRFKILNANIFKINPIEIGKYNCVIMDPPWYSLYFVQFIWLASQCVKIGGTVIISLPPINTRPSIETERMEWFKFCQQQGLILENFHAQVFQYVMPFFEFNAFRAAGVEDILPNWRKGDLAIFRKVEDKKSKRPTLKENLPNWVEKEINSVRFRVKLNNSKKIIKELTIKHLISGDILPTVSSREPLRNIANVWTSGNRIYMVSDPNHFFKILKNYEQLPPKTTKNKNIVDFINTISSFEEKEYNNYLNWLYYELEREIS